MKGNIKSMIAGLIIGVTISGLTAFALTDEVQKTLNYNDIKIKLNGEELIPVDANGDYVEPFTIDGTTYLPVRAIASAMGLEVEWNSETSTVILNDKTADSSESENVIYEKDGVKISYTGLKVFEEYLAYNLLIENNSDKNVFIQGYSVYADGFAMGDNATFGGEIEAGKKAAKFIDIRKYHLENSGINTVETLEFVLRIDGNESKVVFNP